MDESASLHTRLASRIRDRNRSRLWWIRAPLLVWFALTLLSFLADPTHRSLWSGINLGFHEIGHILFGPFPDLITAVGGTLAELAFPIVAGILLMRRGDDFGGAFALFWLGTVLAGAAPYAGDARSQLLPLVSPFPGPVGHDWNYILGTLGLLEHDTLVSEVLRTAGLGAMSAAIAAGGWVVTLIATDPDRAPRTGRAGGGGDALAREDAAFRAWWAEREAEGEAPHPLDTSPMEEAVPPSGTHSGQEPAPNEPSDVAANWLDRKEAHDGTLTPEEERFREWLRKQD